MEFGLVKIADFSKKWATHPREADDLCYGESTFGEYSNEILACLSVGT